MLDFALKRLIWKGNLTPERYTNAWSRTHRWYIGYDLGEVVPDHSSLSKIRERYGLEVFHRFFEHINASWAFDILYQ